MKRQYSILDEIQRMHDEMDSLFANFFGADPFLSRNQHLLLGPSENKNAVLNNNYRQAVSDIYETDKEIVAEIELPGVDKKDIKVQVNNDSIEIQAETKKEVKDEDKKKGTYRFERSYLGFCRTFSLPKNVDANNADAEYKDGVLKIKVPKLEIEKQEKKLLQIK